MSNTRLWVIGTALAGVVVLGGSWFAGAQPLLANAATTTQSAVGAEARNVGLQTQLTTLTRLAAKADVLQAQDADLQKAVPSVLKPNTFIRRVSEVAALDGVTVESVTPSGASPYAAPPSAAGAAAAPADPSSTGDQSAPSPAAVPVPTVPALALTDPLISGANFTVVPTSVTVSGGGDAVLQFASDIQNDQRVFLVNTVSTTTSQDTGIVTATLGGFIYTLKR